MRSLHRTANESGGSRSRKKLLAKSEWFKGKKKRTEDCEEQDEQQISEDQALTFKKTSKHKNLMKER